ncbi:MAG: hypothetical protein IPG17_19955 [Sandaracinaceae bacterium]|jgi:hypothetical protein|nr:hypothetical protein [Sandaracinaceae bacterium]MBP7680266.1 hypothetical protein [Deltaproteobacteria bacterium]MBK6808220.1 hypothetical protein [Sandaracinaceae bacterium]MBK7779005.1 hypothetical protein [Sandaracinaceae bacterium]MBK8411540.1 hypothetical protein [Sandaracinaceae bacterium]
MMRSNPTSEPTTPSRATAHPQLLAHTGLASRLRRLPVVRLLGSALLLTLVAGTSQCSTRPASEASTDATATPRDTAPPRDGQPPVVLPDPGTPLTSANVFFLGHSLQGWQAPAMIANFSTHAGATYNYKAAIGIGANLAWQWEHPERAEGHNPRTTLAAEPFDVLVMTEAIPLASQIAGADSSGNFGRFLALAHAQNPNVQAYLYETWDYLTVSNWRAQLDSDRALWASIITDVNAAHPGRDVLLIPGGRAMAALHDRIEAGQVPGITNLRDLFTDDVHLTNTGWYFIAMVQYATIFRRSPVGLPAATTNRFGEAIPPPPAAAVPVMQEVAWQVVLGDPLAGVQAP